MNERRTLLESGQLSSTRKKRVVDVDGGSHSDTLTLKCMTYTSWDAYSALSLIGMSNRPCDCPAQSAVVPAS